MLRIILVENDMVDACHGGKPNVRYKTVDIEAPAVEAWLAEPGSMNDHYTTRSIVGVEALPAEAPHA